MSFSQKKINTNTLGDFFKQKRQEKGVTLKQVEIETGVIKKFLQYIEDDDLHKISGYVYTKGAVLKYADFLGLNKDEVLKRLQDVLKPNKDSKFFPPSSKDKKKPLFTFKTGVFILGFVMIISYLGLNIFQALAMPDINVISPKENLITESSSLLIKGKAEEQAEVFINNQSIQSQENGYFEKSIELLPGVNTIKISAKKKHSNKAEVVRQVLYKDN